MQRTPEPELMDDPIQALAYAEADFSEPHDHFIALFRQHFGDQAGASILDLGCGPGDICRRFARAYPQCEIHGVDASEPMISLGGAANREQQLDQRITLLQGYLPNAILPRADYDTIISNSMLHHLGNPDTLWQCVNQYGSTGTRVFVMDLLRPDTPEQAHDIVDTHAGDEPEVLQLDFYNSLLAAYRPEEVKAQLAANGLGRFNLEVVSDRHFIVWGQLTR